MCGLAVIARTSSAPAGQRPDRPLRAALPRLARRGPDASGLDHAAGRRVDLLHTRLAIQDLSPAGAQPMRLSLPDGRALTLVYNGEIYNTAELRAALAPLPPLRSHSDTELILHAIARWGFAPALDRLRGMFALVCITARPDDSYILDAAVDHAGMKPLAWALTPTPGGPALAIASDTAALRAILPAAPPIDTAALIRVLVCGYSPAPHTMWRGVSKLPPGSRLHWRPGSDAPTIHTWWSPPARIPDAPPDDPHAALKRLLPAVALEHLAGDVPIAMFLSAGIDSGAVALALRCAGADMSRITALTLSTADTTDGGDESADAADLARRLGMPHRVVPFPASDLPAAIDLAAQAFDEPQGYTALLTASRIAAATRAALPDARVVITGDGGDEAFAGYPWHLHSDHPFALDAPPDPAHDPVEHDRLAALVATPDARGVDRLAANLAWSRRSSLHRYARRLFDGFHPAEAAALVGAPPATLDDDLMSWLGPADAPALPWPRRAQRLDLLGFCAGSITPKLDRSAMAYALELRCPLLDRRILDWSLALPPIPGERTPGSTKPLLRAFLARGVADGHIPDAVLARPKRGFSLRLPDPAVFDTLAQHIDASPIVASGLLRADWPRFIPRDPATRHARLALLANLAAWHATHAQ